MILLLLGYLAYTGVQDSKSYYVTIKELHKMGDSAYSKRLRVAGNVQPGSIKRTGTHVQFVLMEEDQTLARGLYRDGSAAGHVQRRFPGAGGRALRSRRNFSCEATAGQVRVEICSAATWDAGERRPVFPTREECDAGAALGCGRSFKLNRFRPNHLHIAV